MKKTKKALIISAIILAVTLTACLVVVKFSTYHSKDSSWNVSTSDVRVIVDSNIIFYDGPGSAAALIFYPGGFVEYNCYSELLKAIASRGIDCFSVKMPMNFAFFGENKAEKILSSYNYEKWYIGGHSLGGVVACKFASNNYSKLDAVILFASYSVYNLKDKNLKVLSIFGSNDKVLNRDEYEKGILNLPSDFYELEIAGANHCQFGVYGFQKGDGQATISNQQQIDAAADFVRNNLILSF